MFQRSWQAPFCSWSVARSEYYVMMFCSKLETLQTASWVLVVNLFGKIVTCFRNAAIDVHSVCLPPSKLNFVAFLTQYVLIYGILGGQKSRIAFAKITFKKPHILLLDEPSDHLDLDAVEALIQGLVLFQGGVLMVVLINSGPSLWAG
ncbi:ABC transporter F family member 2-like [Lycium barbarum]|uniref:ABC transporter F family member 2-like n=1 Tax=Lycium barbarum TaxID=112863 RepID=UPI00293F7982|nr:ABC transporter F family member 2-like [Lycium barbarum]